MRNVRLSYVDKPLVQDLVDEILVKTKGQSRPKELKQLLDHLFKELAQSRIDTILLACTDLNIVLGQTDVPFQLVDASDCLAQAIVEQWLEW